MRGLTRFEHRGRRVIPAPRFALRMGRAILLWIGLTIIGMCVGYATTEGMGATDAFVNAAMILRPASFSPVHLRCFRGSSW